MGDMLGMTINLALVSFQVWYEHHRTDRISGEGDAAVYLHQLPPFDITGRYLLWVKMTVEGAL